MSWATVNQEEKHCIAEVVSTALLEVTPEMTINKRLYELSCSLLLHPRQLLMYNLTALSS